MKQDVRQTIVRNDETVALGDIEPFDDPGELDDGCCLVVSDVDSRLRAKPKPFGISSDAMMTLAAPEFRLLKDAFANLFNKRNSRTPWRSAT